MHKKNRTILTIAIISLAITPLKVIPSEGLFASPTWLPKAITYGSYIATAAVIGSSVWHNAQAASLPPTPVALDSAIHQPIYITDPHFQREVLTSLDANEPIDHKIIASLAQDTLLTKGIIRQLLAYNSQLQFNTLKTHHDVLSDTIINDIKKGIKDSFKAINKEVHCIKNS